MLDLFNIPTPQSANYQEFYGGSSTRDWVKPRGVSMVRFMLIGAGGAGGIGSADQGGGGGGSGAVTSWIGPAMFVPDILRITIGAGGTSGVDGTASSVIYQAKNTTGFTLLEANGGVSGTTAVTGGTGATAMTANQFTASGIFTSIAGQLGQDGSVGSSGTSQTSSATTFLSGGAGGAGGVGGIGGSVTPNYNYLSLPQITGGGTFASADGYFITQPILVGCGGGGGTTSTTAGTAGGRGGIGCGGGGSGEDATTVGRGGDGAVFIWAW